MWASGSKPVDVVVPTSSLYFQRTGASSYDYGMGDFTRDNTWREKDISGIVPVGTTKVEMSCRFYAAGTPHEMLWRKGGETNSIMFIKRESGDEAREYQWSFWVDVSNDRKVEYKITAGAMNNLDITILGGFKDV